MTSQGKESGQHNGQKLDDIVRDADEYYSYLKGKHVHETRLDVVVVSLVVWFASFAAIGFSAFALYGRMIIYVAVAFLAAIVIGLGGNSLLVRLKKITEGTKSTILAKLENLNPGGSVKDRIGRVMIEEAEKKGLLKPGGTIIEPTSGNTGTGLAMAACVKGYKMIFTMPDKMSDEKRSLLRAYGARVVVTPTNVSPNSPEHYIKVAERLAKETPNSFMPNQYVNAANPMAHYQTTGPEIWRQTGGKLDVFVCGMGTGGTISGTGRFLKEKKKTIKVVGVDPEGSIFFSRYHGTQEEPHQYRLEGIGEDFMPKTMNMKVVDDVITVSDQDAFKLTRRLAREEGILVGGSGGAAVFAALKVAEVMSKEQTVVTLFADSGRNYLSKIFSDQWMKEQGFL